MSDVEAKKNLRSYLDSHGYLSYPREMAFGDFKWVYCDVVAYKRPHFYAFEIKQKGDNISKAHKQLKNYSIGVHYCIVVVDVIGVRQAKRFVDNGYGIWKRVNAGYTEISKPKLMDALHAEIKYTRSKFKRELSSLMLPKCQSNIDDFKVNKCQ